jgi:hypothetical protein
MFIPYFSKPYHPTLEYIKKATDKAFEIGDYEIFEFNGGEPFLRDDLPEIFEHALQYKDNVTDRIKLVTNGTKLPERRLLDVWKKYGDKFFCIVDDYGSLSPNASAAYEMIKNAGIPCELRDLHSENRHHGGWVDFLVKGRINNEEEAKEAFSKCSEAKILKHCCNIIKGVVMPCAVQFQLKYKGIDEPLPHEFIDLFNEDEPLEEKRKKMAGFHTIDYLTSCFYCKGVNSERERYKPGEQMSDEEHRMLQPKFQIDD